MLSYRHIYHAGNIGDVLKHPLLCLLLKSLHAKPKPFCYMETHAGAGSYDLKSSAAQKNKEFVPGVERIRQAQHHPESLNDYLQAISSVNAEDRHLRYYPGSPTIARTLLRPRDRMILRELNRNDCNALHAEFRGMRDVIIECADGYQGLVAHLPPKERRGLVLIDPSYEDPDEFDRIVTALQTAVRRWSTGIFAVWYPLLARYPIADFHRRIQTSGIGKVLRMELAAYPLDSPVGLNGSGLLVVNPPYQFDTQVTALLPWLKDRIDINAQASYRCDWLVSEDEARKTAVRSDNGNDHES